MLQTSKLLLQTFWISAFIKYNNFKNKLRIRLLLMFGALVYSRYMKQVNRELINKR